MGNCVDVESMSPELEGYNPERWILIEDRIKDDLDLEQNNLLSDEVRNSIKRCLMRSGIFGEEVNLRKIMPSDTDRIVNAFKLKTFDDGEILFKQNDRPCDNMYIIKRGIFRGKDSFGTSKAIMREGDIMGEIGFFQESPRLLSIVADAFNGVRPTAYCLTKRDFKAIVEKGRDLSVIKIFESLSDGQKHLLRKRVTIANFIKGQFYLHFNVKSILVVVPSIQFLILLLYFTILPLVIFR